MKQFLLSLLLSTCYTLSIAQDLNAEFQSIAEANDMMGGSLVVFCDDGIIENIAYGTADLDREIAMNTGSKYRIASISKTITAIAIMQLVEDGLLQLDDDIGSILGYTVQNPSHTDIPITVKMLLSHTSTIIDGPTYSNFLGATVSSNPIPDLSELITTDGEFYTASQFNNTTPGTYFNYSNANYVILGTIVEKVSNQRFDEYCLQHISTPLSLDASFNVNHLTDINELAVIYRKPGGSWTPQVDDYEGAQPVFDNLESYTPGTNGGRFGPQGGFRCSAEDLSRIMLCLMNDGSFNGVELLTSESCQFMFNNEWTYNGSNGNNYYGLFLSWGLGIHRITSSPGNDLALPESTTMLGHAGEAYGLVSDAYFDPERRVGFVFMTNGVGNGYQTNDASVFYTVEQEVFNAVEEYGNIADCALSTNITESSLEKDTLFPNPSNDFILTKDLPIHDASEIKIYDSSGKLIASYKPEDISEKIMINHLNTGIYTLVIGLKKYTFIKS